MGSLEDVRQEIIKSHCVVLPSYREGTPRSLLEASNGKTNNNYETQLDVKVVDNGVNGFLCQIGDAKDLSNKMIKLIKLSTKSLNLMGLRSRKKAEEEFDEKIIIDRYIEAVNTVCDRARPAEINFKID